jgi:serine/threonine-protein kinase ULK2
VAVDLEPLPDPSKFAPREGENEKVAARRRNADVQAEYNAVTCVAIYMLVMQFSQKGIDELRKYQEHMEMRHPEGDFVLSEGFDEGALLASLYYSPSISNSNWSRGVGGVALVWFKDHFLRCNDRAALVKTWLPAQYTGPTTWVDELVYNRALTLVRTFSSSHSTPNHTHEIITEPDCGAQ